MAENIEMIRPINLPEAQQLSENDVFILDSETGGVRKIPKNKVYTPVDDTLSESGEAADAKVTGEKIDEVKAETELIQNPVGNKSGELVSFSDGADMPAISVIAHIEPIQEGEGDPSPDNVRAISGWESVNVNVTGKNLLNIHSVGSQRMVANGITFTLNEDGTATANGTATGTAQIYWNNIPSATYAETWSGKVLNGCPSISGCSLRIEKANSPWTNYATDTGNGATIGAIPSNAGELSIYCRVAQGTTLNNAVFKPMIRVSGASAEYESYNGHTTTTSLGRTVYGGTLDVVSGVLTVTHGYQLFDSSVPCYGVSTNYGTGFNRVLYSTLENEAKRGANIPIVSDKFAYIATTALALYKGHINSNGILCLGVPDTITTTAEMQAWAGQNPFVIVYELATPQTYQLTPTEIQTLLGENNVWADAGAVSVTYRRDINLALEQLEALLNS